MYVPHLLYFQKTCMNVVRIFVDYIWIVRNFYNPTVVISISSIGGKQDGPLFGILSAASKVNTDLK